jgi:hypothetical protein
VPFPALSGSLTGLAIDEGSGLATDGLVLQDRAADAFTVRLELRPASPRAVPFDARWPLDPHAFELPYTILRPAPDTLCFYVTQTSAGRARLVCSNRGVSMDVSADGTMREAHAWPAPVSGEIEWQDGAVAWTCGERSRLYRRTALGLAEEVELPARAFVAFATGEQVLFPSIEGGVWAWRPGGTCEQLIDTPPVNSIRRVEDGFELDPILVTEGPSFPRVRLDYTWAWNPAARTVTRRPSDAAGQSAPVATLEGWTAQVSPYADVVRVASPSGWSVRLHVAHALMAAFAGTSLVVTTGSGLVLLFEGLRDRLAERERIGRDSAR